MRELRQQTIIRENHGAGAGKLMTKFVKSVIIKRVAEEVKAAINI